MSNNYLDNIIEIKEQTQNENTIDLGVSPRELASKLHGSSIALIERMTKEIDQPIFKSLAKDMLGTLAKFYDNEEALCCLVKNLVTMSKIQDFRDRNLTKGNNTIFLQFNMPFIDHTIAVIDTIIAFLELDLIDLVMPYLDFAKILAEGVVGALIMTLQQIVFTLRDTTIAWICDELDKAKKSSNSVFLKCAPLMDLIELIKKYISDYGLLSKLMSLISGFIGGNHAKFKKYQSLPKHLKSIEFLKSVKRILEQIRTAVLEWDLCVDQSFSTNDSTTPTNQDPKSPGAGKGGGYASTPPMNEGTPKTKGSILTDKDTILSNMANTSGISSDGSGGFFIPNNNEVKNFLVNYMGISNSIADYLVSTDDRNQQGTLGQNPSQTNSDCGYTLQQSDINNILKSLLRK